MSHNIYEAKLLGLWTAVSEITENIHKLAEEYIQKADETRITEPVNSINLRGQAIGLLEANAIIGKTLRDRELLP